MLALSFREGERVYLGDNQEIKIQVLEVRGNKVVLGFDGDIRVLRGSVVESDKFQKNLAESQEEQS